MIEIGLSDTEILAKAGVNFEDLTHSLTNSGLGYWIWNISGDTFLPSQSLISLLKLKSPYPLTRDSYLKLAVHHDDIDVAKLATKELLEHGKPYNTLVRFKHGSGHYRWVQTHGSLVRDASGKPKCVIGTVSYYDILENAAQDLIRSENLAKLGNWKVNVKSQKLEWSQGSFKIYGYEPHSFEPTLDFARSKIEPQDLEQIRKIIDHAILEQTPFEYKARIHGNFPVAKTVKVIGNVEVGITGETVSYFGTIQDISAEVEHEQKIRQSQKLETIGKLTGGVAHDFNNLLAVILGNLEFLKENPDVEDRMDLIESAIQASLRGADLTKSMLSFARKAHLVPAPLNINDIVRHMKNWMLRILPENITVESSLLAGLWQAELDKRTLENAILNLVINARDAMPNGGKLTIETANMRIDDDYIFNTGEDVEPGRYVMLAISDTGLGIPKNQIDEIFQPFFTTKPPGAGSGLGLSMVQGFVKQSKGAVRVYSEERQGTTFKLYFKEISGNSFSKKERPLETLKDVDSGTRILLVEDDEAVLVVLKRVLKNYGYSVVTASSGDLAKSIYRKDPTFDLLVTDIVMPGNLQGTTLAKELRSLNSELSVVFMSGYAKEATIHGNGLRPEDIRLMKPVTHHEILAAVQKALLVNRKQHGGPNLLMNQ